MQFKFLDADLASLPAEVLFECLPNLKAVLVSFYVFFLTHQLIDEAFPSDFRLTAIRLFFPNERLS